MSIFRIRTGWCSIWTKVTHRVLCGLCFVQGTKCFFQGSYSLWEVSGELKGKLKKKSFFSNLSGHLLSCSGLVEETCCQLSPELVSLQFTPHPLTSPAQTYLGTSAAAVSLPLDPKWHLSSSSGGQSNTFSPSRNQLNSLGTSNTLAISSSTVSSWGCLLAGLQSRFSLPGLMCVTYPIPACVCVWLRRSAWPEV